MENLKVGDRFYKWRLGYDIHNSDGLPEHLKKFYEVYIVEKVNKVTFVANGEKYKEIDKYWNHNIPIDTLEKWACNEAARYFVAQLDGGNRYYNTADYKKMLSEASKDNLNAFNRAYKVEFQRLVDRVMDNLKSRASEKLKEVLGGK